MRKILLTLSTGYCGMDAHEAWLIPDDVEDKDLDTWAWERAVDHASHYDIYPEYELEDGEEPECDGGNISADWRIFEDRDLGKVTYGNKDKPEWNVW